MGIRLKTVYDEAPKGLLEIEGKAIIQQSIENLICAGINSILLVIGYLAPLYRSFFKDYSEIKLIENTDYAKTGSMHSFFLARDFIENDFLLLESDLIYEKRALDELTRIEHRNCILISGYTHHGDEVYAYGNENNHLISLSKSHHENPVGELVGISRISQELFKAACDYYEKNITTPFNYNYEDCLTALSESHPIHLHKVEDLIWCEIDDDKQYNIAINQVFPELKKPMSANRKILLNPGPGTTSQRVKDSLKVDDICPREKDFGNLIDNLRTKLTRVVSAEKTHTAVLFAGSGTAAVESCISSLMGADDKLLIIDNGAYGERAHIIAKAYGVPHKIIHYRWDAYPDVIKIEEEILKEASFTHCFFVHHETTTGMLNPLEAMLQLCRKHQLVSIVDTISSYAGIPLDLSQVHIDYLISTSSKCIQGFPGVCFVIAEKAALWKT
jgi:2-aminoethylphosphonate-pyruvate transaminase